MGIDWDDVYQADGGESIREGLNEAVSPWPEVPPYPEEMPEAADITAHPFAWRDEADIPARQWVYGHHLIRKFVSVDVAAGGIGKSSLKVVEALALASGKPLLNKPIDQPYRVWLYNLEDPAEEIERRIHAAMKHFNLSPEDIGDRLYVDSGRDQPLILAEDNGMTSHICSPVKNALTEELKARQIDVLTVDPFVSSHRLNENDNRAIDLVTKQWSQIADECNCAINLVHHAKKSTGFEVGVDIARGASSLIGAARSVSVYSRMSKDEAQDASVSSEARRYYFKVQIDKANLAPPEAADWYHMQSIELNNGDKVGVATPWKWPDTWEGITLEHLRRIQSTVESKDYQHSSRSKQWFGYLVAEVTGLSVEHNKAQIKRLISKWIENEMFTVVTRQGDNRHSLKFVEVGKWVDG